MNKSIIKKFAVEARKRLLEQVAAKLFQYGISENGIIPPQGSGNDYININGKLYDDSIKKKYKELSDMVRKRGYESVKESVAYTWFNRFIAIRFMEVNNYLPTGISVFSSIVDGRREPDLLHNALVVDLGVDKEIVYKFQDSNDDEGLYKYLFILQCNSLHKILPFLFEKIEDYSELLLPDNLLYTDSIINKMVNEIPPEDW